MMHRLSGPGGYSEEYLNNNKNDKKKHGNDMIENFRRSPL